MSQNQIKKTPGALSRFFDFFWDGYDRAEKIGLTKLPQEAAALSYFMALAVVPFLAICFALAKSFGLEEALTRTLSENFAGQENILGPLKGFAENMINSFSGSLLAVVAILVILWSGIRLLTQMENVLGPIFGYNPQRDLLTKLPGYLAIFLTMPAFLILAGAINVYVAGLNLSTWNLPFIEAEYLVTISLKTSPYLVWWFIMGWVYTYFSRGVMRWPERFLGGIIAGTIFQLFQVIYLKLMFALTSYNAIYGSFAAVPLFMVWLYCSWLIIMAGAEITRRISDKITFGLKLFSLHQPLNWLELKEMSQKIMNCIYDNYEDEPIGRSTTIRNLSKTIKKPLPIIGATVTILMNEDILARVRSKGRREPAFLPLRSRHHLTDEVLFELLAKHSFKSA